MKRKVFKSTVYFFFLLLLTSFSAFAVPKYINYQGKLTDKSGNVLDGDYQMKFSIFDSKTGSENALWEEQQNVTITEGIYSIQLGVNTPLPLELFDNEDLYLEVSITSDGITYESLSPRQHLTSVPFAMKSANAKTLDGMTASDFISKGEDNAIEGNMIGDGAVGPTNLADNSVTSAKIVDGTIRLTDLSFSLPDGHSLDAADGDLVNALYVNNAGNVGIGTTDPRSKLDVNGNIHTSGKVLANAYSSNSPLILEAPTGTERARIDDNTGNFGIGMMGSPGARLDVFMLNEDKDSYIFRIASNVLSEPSQPPYRIVTRLVVTNDGRVGIGTSLPNSKTDVVDGNMRAELCHMFFTTSRSGVRGTYGEDATGYLGMRIYPFGGTPAYYGVYGLATSSEKNIGVYGRASGGSENWAGYFRGNLYASGNIGICVVDEDPYSTNDYGNMSFKDKGNGGLVLNSNTGGSWADISLQTNGTTRMFIESNGNVGIGTTIPTKELTVRGNLLVQDKSTGNDALELGTGLDYAEGFDVTEQVDIEAGMVLVIDPQNPGNLMLSRFPYDTKVAGIVAGANGLGSGVRLGIGQFDYDVALAGRVYCNVDATEASIEPGDLLTTSARPGYAMKVLDYTMARGAILGKAMGRLEIGQTGQIMVLVTLQ